MCDFLPVTSNQEFFGISVMKGIYMALVPLLPKRLTYPELFDIDLNGELFYKSQKEFKELLEKCIVDYDMMRKKTCQIQP